LEDSMLKKLMVAALGAIALAGCGIEIYEYPTGFTANQNASSAGILTRQGGQAVSTTPMPSATPASTYNHNPLILSFTANPLNVVNPGDSATFTVDAIDEDHDNLKYTWSATGGVLSSTTGRLVSWTPPARAGVYTILVSLSDGRGGTAEGAQNIIVKADGSSSVFGQPAIANNDATTSL
jgi:hypothetical protein